MRLAIVSDVHGNLTALEAVVCDVERRGVDGILHGGDLVLGGAQPAEVLDLIRELAWPGVVGNTDELLWRPEEQAVQLRKAPRLADLLGLLFECYAPATRGLIGAERLGWLRRLPATVRRRDLAVVHASPGDLWRAPAPDAQEAELRATYAPCGADLVVYGHIHRPYARRLDGLTVANSGSVGSPFDGDPRASYLLVDAGEPRVIRVEYDVEREVAALVGSAYPDRLRIAEMRRRGRFVPPTG